MDYIYWALLIIFVLAVTGVFWINSWEKDQKEKFDLVLSKIDGFESQFEHTSTNFESGIAVDENNKKIALLSLTAEPRIYSYSDLLAVELTENGQSLTKTSRTSQAANAILGGILLGGVGAIVGALTSAQKTKTKVKSVDIELTINDTAEPVFRINFQNVGDKAGGHINEPAMKNANEWMARFRVIMKQADLEDTGSAADMKAQPELSVAGEIAKLADLRAQGLLTIEEFDFQKSKLLG